MRYLVGFVLALTLMTLPLSMSAEAGEESATSEPDVVAAVPASQAAAEEPGLQPRSGAPAESSPTQFELQA